MRREWFDTGNYLIEAVCKRVDMIAAVYPDISYGYAIILCARFDAENVSNNTFKFNYYPFDEVFISTSRILKSLRCAYIRYIKSYTELCDHILSDDKGKYELMYLYSKEFYEYYKSVFCSENRNHNYVVPNFDRRKFHKQHYMKKK